MILFYVILLSWGWKTRSQIIALHGGDSKAADEIIAEKVMANMVQDHPDSASLKTYYVTLIAYINSIQGNNHIYEKPFGA